MNIKFFNVALGIALTTTTLSASAQKSYTNGTLNMSTTGPQGPIEAKTYFTPDSAAITFEAGPAKIKVLKDNKDTYFAVIVDVSQFNVRKAGIATPAEVEEMVSAYPKLTFAPTSEAKQISGFNCKKVVATDAKGTKYDVWITNDISLPKGVIPVYYAAIGGVPVQYTSFAQGQSASVTLNGVSDEAAPAGTFGIPKDFDKMTLEELKAMQGGGQ
ncbi:DUF4412 domain-containing protein [Mucilaginibacter sp. L3T2-6]|uniref:DUF4412 domain-containing protein n=1 Tax=Mucilaginibacter sp. L3T2-6 TaxID=3062491 RepID=UPI002674F72A|nr:DUF4412 domain-containing protein [Mucilaginibacter sp. L3T2-6]MDO3641103.1 DUF4412 domain-containing protein [Mucilaginibacter sp. L3T2-6]MDV6213421.1 DUF4412 domain-containing protein [Mucilaginibacter sp. L3T2-6]